MNTFLVVAFWSCTALLFQTYVGYPLCVWLLARCCPRPVQTRESAPPVTVIVAVHDGAAHIEAKLRNLLSLDYPPASLAIIVACDGCRDATVEICDAVGDPRIQALDFPLRRGKAACLNDAVRVARSDVLLMTDVRQRLEPAVLRELVANLADPAVGAVSGELRMEHAQTGFARGVDAYWRYETWIRACESRSGSMVGVTGALYAMRRDLYQDVPSTTVLDDVLIPMQVARAGHRVVLEPRAVAWDRPSQQPAAERRRKVRTLAGNYQLLVLAPWLLGPLRNPLWFRFVNHKLLRLLAPWLLLALLPVGAMLAAHGIVYVLALGSLLAGMALVALGRLLPALAPLPPVRLATAFFYLNWFSAEALIAFTCNRRLHLW